MDHEADLRFIREAIALSRAAAAHGNEPFGAVLVRNGAAVMTNENQIFTRHDPSFHAELGLLRRFSAETGITDLRDYTLYSSCEPCFMCSGAMVWFRLGRLVYAASNRDLNACFGRPGTDCSELVFSRSSHRPTVTAGLCAEEAREVLRDCFGS